MWYRELLPALIPMLTIGLGVYLVSVSLRWSTA
jgi:hypothetical protein